MSGEQEAEESEAAGAVEFSPEMASQPPKQHSYNGLRPVPSLYREQPPPGGAWIQAVVSSLSKYRGRGSWTELYSPLYNTYYYAFNLPLPLDTSVTFYQGRDVSIDGQYLLGVDRTSLEVLDRDELEENNEGAQQQMWIPGKVHSRARGETKGGQADAYNLEVNLGRKYRRAHRLFLEPSTLLPGSHTLPVGSPVIFQTIKSRTSKKVEVVAACYDPSRLGEHMGPTPSSTLLSAITDSHGQHTLHLGGTSKTSVVGVSILDILEELNCRPDSASLQHLLLASRAVLERRLAECKDEETRATLEASVTQLKGEELSFVLISPTLFSPQHWRLLINRHYHRQAQEDYSIASLVVVSEVAADVSIDNIDHRLGFLNRLPELWRAGQHLCKISVRRECDAFVRLDQSHLAGSDSLHPPTPEQYEADAILAPVPDHNGGQTLLEEYGPEPTPLEDVERSAGDTTFVPRERPSLRVSFRKERGTQAMRALEKALSPEGNDYTETPHPDARCRAYRITPITPSTHTELAVVATALNQASLKGLLHASVWETFQEKDNAKVRTLICRSGYLPPLKLLQSVDASVAKCEWVHGVVRIHSELSTAAWSRGLSVINDAAKADKKRFQKDSFCPFQAIQDGEGLRWICTPATAPPARPRSWASLSPGQRDRPYSLSSQQELFAIYGPGQSWDQETIKEALSALNIPEGRWAEAKWAEVSGALNKTLVLPQDGLTPASALLRDFIPLRVEALTVTQVRLVRPVFTAPTVGVDMDRVEEAVAAMASSQDLGETTEDPQTSTILSVISPEEAPPQRQILQRQDAPKAAGSKSTDSTASKSNSKTGKGDDKSDDKSDSKNDSHGDDSHGNNGSGYSSRGKGSRQSRGGRGGRGSGNARARGRSKSKTRAAAPHTPTSTPKASRANSPSGARTPKPSTPAGGRPSTPPLKPMVPPSSRPPTKHFAVFNTTSDLRPSVSSVGGNVTEELCRKESGRPEGSLEPTESEGGQHGLPNPLESGATTGTDSAKDSSAGARARGTAASSDSSSSGTASSNSSSSSSSSSNAADASTATATAAAATTAAATAPTLTSTATTTTPAPTRATAPAAASGTGTSASSSSPAIAHRVKAARRKANKKTDGGPSPQTATGHSPAGDASSKPTSQ